MRPANFRAFFRAMGPAKIAEALLLSAFVLLFFGPLLHLAMLAFADTYFYPSFLPARPSLKWWGFVLSQDNLASSMVLSFAIAAATTALALVICVPAAYAFARLKFPLLQFSFSLSCSRTPSPRSGCT